MNLYHQLNQILADPTVRTTLKDAIRAFDNMDPTDAANDAALLRRIMLDKLQALPGFQPRPGAIA
jgi:hypothetical protein